MSLPKPGPIALRAADEAEANCGVHEEGGENAGKYVQIYLASVGLGKGAPWCAAFVYYRLKAAAAGLHLPWPQKGYPRSGYCPDIQHWAIKHGVWIPLEMATEGGFNPERGDLALYYFPAKDRVAHVGIVVAPTPLGFNTVEGNTSDDSGVNRDGDGVYLKKRKLGALGTGGGFVRLGF